MYKIILKFKRFLFSLILAASLFYPASVFADATYSNSSYGDCSFSSNCPTAPTNSTSSFPKSYTNNASSPTVTPPEPQTPQSNLIVDVIGGNILTPSNIDTLLKTSNTPTVNGKAPANSTITVTYHPVDYTCIIYADNSGNWSCTLDRPLKPGIYTVEITAKTQTGQVLSSPIYRIQAINVSLKQPIKKHINVYLIPIIVLILFLALYLLIVARNKNKNL